MGKPDKYRPSPQAASKSNTIYSQKTASMKKAYFLVATLFLAYTLQAQTTIKPAVGLNFTDWSQDDASGEFRAKAGWQIGGSVAFGKKFYVEPGIFYVGKSTEFEVNASNPSFDNFKANLNGIRVPVAVGANLLGNEKTAFSLRGFGGFSGFFVTSVGDDIDKADVNTAQWGVFAGAGIDIWKIFLDLSYEWSLTNVQKDVSLIDFGKTRSLFINAGIRINL
jgi:hypothetical protein